VITPRKTRLVRVRDLHAFRDAIVALAAEREVSGSLFVVVPSAGAARQLERLIQHRHGDDRSPRLDLVTREELYDRLHAGLLNPPPRLTPYERDVIVQAAAREASAELGAEASAFQLRAGLVAEMLRFYDQLRRQGQPVARFEELLEEALQRDAEFDRGADRMLRQTRLLAATFRAYQRRAADSGGCDEHMLRERLIVEPLSSPVDGVIITVADWIADPGGLYVADFDLLARLPGVRTLDLVATDRILGSGFHQRIHGWLPGLDEVEWKGSPVTPRPVLSVPAAIPDHAWFVNRDREEELIGIARRLKADRRAHTGSGLDPPPLDRVAVVYRGPLPYLYLARRVFGGAGMAYQTSDTLPLAAEPFAAALDLVFDFVTASFSRDSLIALLRSPHFRFDGSTPIDRWSISALDRALSQARYLGEVGHLSQLAVRWQAGGEHRHAWPALGAAVSAAEELLPLREAAPASTQIQRLLSFLESHGAEQALPISDAGVCAPWPTGTAGGARQRRARTAIIDTLKALASASRAHDDAPLDIDGLRATVRRWIEEHTFAVVPVEEQTGVHLVDEHAARYGDFDELALVGLIEGEWPERPRRNIFYSPAFLGALGWPPERDWRSSAEARFIDLLESAAARVSISTITLDDEALVEPSPLLDEIPRARLSTVSREASPAARIFVDEALSLDPVAVDPLPPDARAWAEMRLARALPAEPAFHGQAGAPPVRPWSVSAVEAYLQCPFKFFAQHVLRLEEEPDDEEVMDSRQQGQFVHEVFEAFFDEWQDSGHQGIVPRNLDEARAAFEQVVGRSLGSLSDTEAALERTRLLGSAAAVGLGEAVIRMEAERSVGVIGRLLEHRLEGDFTFDTSSGPRVVSLRGKADRVDLLEDGTFRLVDYKLGWPPNRARALQLAIYSLCAQQRLRGYLGRSWRVGEAVYLAFKGPRRVVPLFSSSDRDRVLGESQERLVDALDAIGRGEFPPRPHDVHQCETCTYTAVCRKDYVGDV
jgi:RecB family exonuclease